MLFLKISVNKTLYDKDGNFIESNSKQEAYKNHESFVQRISTKVVNIFANIFEFIYEKGKDFFDNFIGKLLPENKSKLLISQQSSFLDSLKLTNFSTNDLNFQLENAMYNINHPENLIETANEKARIRDLEKQEVQEEEYTIHSNH